MICHSLYRIQKKLRYSELKVDLEKYDRYGLTGESKRVLNTIE